MDGSVIEIENIFLYKAYIYMKRVYGCVYHTQDLSRRDGVKRHVLESLFLVKNVDTESFI